MAIAAAAGEREGRQGWPVLVVPAPLRAKIRVPVLMVATASFSWPRRRRKRVALAALAERGQGDGGRSGAMRKASVAPGDVLQDGAQRGVRPALFAAVADRAGKIGGPRAVRIWSGGRWFTSSTLKLPACGRGRGHVAAFPHSMTSRRAPSGGDRQQAIGIVEHDVELVGLVAALFRDGQRDQAPARMRSVDRCVGDNASQGCW
jgi:hypothetical protein